MTRREETQVLVVGAGPVGLLTALCLRERGVEVTVVDEEPRGSAHSYALALHSSSLKLLDDLGVARRIQEGAHQVTALEVFEDGQPRAELELGAPLLVVPQSRLEGALRDALQARGVAVGWNRRLAQIEPGEDGVASRVDSLEHVSGGYAVASSHAVVTHSTEVASAFVVAADGHHSTVRRQLEITFREAGEAALFAVFELYADFDSPERARIVLHEDTVNGLWPLGERRWRFAFQLGQADLVPARGGRRSVVQIGQRAYPQVAKRRLVELIAERAPWFDATIGEVPWSVAVRFERRVAERFGEGRVWLAGDAAHVTVPVGVQSMNLGLSEGAELADAMAEAVRQGGPTARLADQARAQSSEWRRLFGLEGGFVAGQSASPWAARRPVELAQCLPASRVALTELAARLGLELQR